MDYFAPVLRRILALSDEVKSIAETSQNILKVSDVLDSRLEDFMSSLEAAHKASLEVYQKGVELAGDKNRLSAELDRLQALPTVAEKSGDLGSMALMFQDLLHQNYVEVAINLGKLDLDLYHMMFKELASYEGWPEKRKAILEAIGNL